MIQVDFDDKSGQWFHYGHIYQYNQSLFCEIIKSNILVIISFYLQILQHKKEVVTALDPAAHRFQTETWYMGVELVESGWIVKIYSTLTDAGAQFVL